MKVYRIAAIAMWAGMVCAGFSRASDTLRRNPVVVSLGGKNLVPNSGFECGPSGWASIGIWTGWGGDLSGLYGRVDDGHAWEGRHSFRIDLGPGLTPVTYADAYPSARVVQASPLAANIGWIDVEPGKPYTLSAYMKADRDGVPARLAVYLGTSPLPFPRPVERAARVTLSDQWCRYSFTLESEEPQVFVAVGPDLRDSPEGSATVWIDAVQFERGPEATPYRPRQEIEAGVYTGVFGNVFDMGQSAEVHVRGHNATDETATVPVRVAFEDYFGTTLPEASADLTIGPGTSESVSLPVPACVPGFYRAAVVWAIGGVEHRENLRIGVIEPYAHADSPFGINHAPPTEELCLSLKRAGVTWVRNCSFDWDQLEPVEGELSFEKSDIQVDRERAAGFNVLALMPVFASTEWNSTAPDAVPTQYPWRRLVYAPKDPELLYEFIRRGVRHYQGRVAHYEFLNEPIWIPSGNLNRAAGYTVDDYIDLLRGAYAAYKTAHPGCTVIGGLGIQAEIKLGDEFIRRGGLNYVDALNLHPYPGVSRPESFIGHMERIREAMDEAGVVRPIWATETGYYCVEDEPWTPFVPTVETPGRFMRDERQAADYAVRHALVLMAHGVEKIFYHQGIESEVNNEYAVQDCPFWVELGTPQKFYVALSALANLLGPAPEFAAKWSVPERAAGFVFGYAFQCGDRALLTVWAPGQAEDDSRYVIRSPDGTDVFDIVGKRIEPGRAVLGESVLYVTSRALAARELARTCLLIDETMQTRD